jgi:large subunit ribosomal protein L11
MGDTIVPVEMTIFEDRTFTFITKTPPASILIKKAIGLSKGSDNALKNKVATIKEAQLEEIAKEKMEDLSANDVEAAKKIIAGTARSMGVTVEK